MPQVGSPLHERFKQFGTAHDEWWAALLMHRPHYAVSLAQLQVRYSSRQHLPQDDTPAVHVALLTVALGCNRQDVDRLQFVNCTCKLNSYSAVTIRTQVRRTQVRHTQISYNI